MGNGAIVATGDMRYRGMSNRVQGYGAYRQWGTGGMGYKGYGPHGQWDTGGMGHMGNEAHWGVWVQGYGHRGMGYKGYEPCGQWDTGLWATWAMGPVGDLLPKYQKDVKLSKRCQVVKKMSNVKK